MKNKMNNLSIKVFSVIVLLNIGDMSNLLNIIDRDIKRPLPNEQGGTSFEIQALEALTTEASTLPSSSYIIEFVLNANYEETVTYVGYDEFCQHIKKELANFLQVPIDYFPNLKARTNRISPLIILTKLVPGPDKGSVRAKQLIEKWTNEVNGGSFCLHVPPIDDHKVCAIEYSFKILSRYIVRERIDSDEKIWMLSAMVIVIVIAIIVFYIFDKFYKRKERKQEAAEDLKIRLGDEDIPRGNQEYWPKDD